VVGALWALDPALANQRQFPAVDWETSYSLYAAQMAPWFARETGPDWPDLRRTVLELLQRGQELRDIAGLVGPEALQDVDRLVLESARIFRELILGQSAYDPNDASSSLKKTHELVALAVTLHRRALGALQRGLPFERLNLGPIRRALAAVRGAPASERADRAAEARTLIEHLGAEAAP
jgi:V/A-type H+-transporting ATPase subunit A